MTLFKEWRVQGTHSTTEAKLRVTLHYVFQSPKYRSITLLRITEYCYNWFKEFVDDMSAKYGYWLTFFSHNFAKPDNNLTRSFDIIQDVRFTATHFHTNQKHKFSTQVFELVRV